MSMFCYQCEQTAGGKGCSAKAGVCGKTADTADAQDVLNALVKGIAWHAHKNNIRNKDVDHYIIDALFTTVTNVNFDAENIAARIAAAAAIRQAVERPGDTDAPAIESIAATPIATPDASAVLDDAIRHGLEHPADDPAVATMHIPQTPAEVLAAREAVAVTVRKAAYGDTVTGLQEVIFYGLKGAAAYMHHARVLGKESDALYAAFCELLAFLAEDPVDIATLLDKALAAGKLNFEVMELLDAANTGVYGHPEPTEVRVTPIKGKCILVSGHDLKDLDLLLKQTQGTGINVYTHGEMLPCLAYPALKKYPHLVGNYGGAWQDQAQEFAAFPGAILMTTNCIQRPREDYAGRIFTTGLVAWPGVAHIGADKDFTPVIDAALAADGFKDDAAEQTITIGFGHNAVMNVAGTVIDAVKAGAIKHFFLIGGCDGAKSGRNYYTDLAKAVPDDCVILTLACGKYRFNKLDFGTIGGIPRLLDIGQCNDAYSAVKIASALADAFGCGINELPLTLVLSWYEQKAVAILLTLLHLGVKNIRLGPTLPAFLTPDALGVPGRHLRHRPDHHTPGRPGRRPVVSIAIWRFPQRPAHAGRFFMPLQQQNRHHCDPFLQRPPPAAIMRFVDFKVHISHKTTTEPHNAPSKRPGPANRRHQLRYGDLSRL